MGKDVFTQCTQSSEFLSRIVNQRCRPQNYYRTVVYRVIKYRAREYQSIKQCYCDTNRDALIEITQHATGGRTVDVQDVSIASIRCWNDKGLPICDETDMAEESFVKNFIDDVTVVDRALRLPHHKCAYSGSALAVF